MTHHAPVSDPYVDEIAEGQCAVVAALVLALDEACVLPRERYSQFLHQLWLAMPDDRAAGGAGVMIERTLAMVGKGAGAFSADALFGAPVGMPESIWPVAPPAPAAEDELELEAAA